MEMWCAARHCAFESHPLRQNNTPGFTAGGIILAKGSARTRAQVWRKNAEAFFVKITGGITVRGLLLHHPSHVLSAIQKAALTLVLLFVMNRVDEDIYPAVNRIPLLRPRPKPGSAATRKCPFLNNGNA